MMWGPMDVLRTALMVSSRTRPVWMPGDGSRYRGPGRHNKRRKGYPHGYNKSREMARRRRQMGMGEFTQLRAAA